MQRSSTLQPLPGALQPRLVARRAAAAPTMALRAAPVSAAASTAAAVAAARLRRPLHAVRSLLAPAAPRLASRRTSRRVAATPVRAMVNVDISPSVVLGVGLIGAGVSLWQIRRVKPWLSKDYDVVVSCISLLVGGILIFQGWRLDPLLLFGQLMTTGAAVSFAIEALRLRSEAYEGEEKAALQDVFRRKGGPGGPGGSQGAAFQLPPPDADSNQQPWAQDVQQPWADQRQWAPAGQPPQQQDGYVGFDASQQQPPAWGDGAQQQWDYGSGGYQPAEYQAYDDGGAAVAGGSDFFGGSSSSSSSGAAGPPIEFTFPASYEDGSSAGAAAAAAPAAAATAAAAAPGADGGWGAPADQQQAPPQQPRQWEQPPAAPGRRGSNFDTMDDW